MKKIKKKNRVDNESDKEAYVNSMLPDLSIKKADPNKTKTLTGFDATHLTAFARRVFGREYTVLKDRGTELSHGYKLDGQIGINDILRYTENNSLPINAMFSIGGDVRLGAEYGGEFDISGKNTIFSNSASIGVLADMSLKSGTLTPAVNPGLELNGSSLFKTRLSDNATLGAGASGYAVFAGFPTNTTSVDYGASGEIQGTYKPNNSNVTVFGAANAGLDKQKISIGGFNEQAENITTLGVTIGAQNRKGSVSLNYNSEINKLNSTKNRKIFSVGATLNI